MRHYTRHHQHRQRRHSVPDGWPADMPPPRTDDHPELRPGADIGEAVLRLYGDEYRVPLRWPGTVNGKRNRARSDQVAAQIGGEWLVLTIRAALEHLAKMPPRVMNRKERAEF